MARFEMSMAIGGGQNKLFEQKKIHNNSRGTVTLDNPRKMLTFAMRKTTMSPVREVHVRYLRFNKKCDVLRIA